MKNRVFGLNRQFFIGLALVLVTLLLFLHARMQGADEEHYLAWGHSIFFDGDLILYNQFKSLGMSYFFTSTGYTGELRNFGVTLFWLPFYTLYKIVSSLFFVPSPLFNDPMQLVFVNWANIIFVLLALGLMFVVLNHYFGKAVSWVSLVLLFFGTPLFYYTLQRSISSHSVSVFLSSLFLFLLVKQTETNWKFLGLGILAGWLMLTASYNIVILAVPIIDLAAMLVVYRTWRQGLLRGVLLGFGLVLGFLPQIMVWRALFGSFTNSPYGRQLNWFDPQLIPTLFSPLHGLFIFSPVLLVAVAGKIFFFKHDRILATGISLSWLLLTYIVSVNLAWWAGASFGNRYFLTLAPFFVLLIGALLHQNWSWLGLFVPGTIWSLGLWLQTVSGSLTLSDAHYTPFSALIGNQTQVLNNISLISRPFTHHWFGVAPISVVIVILVVSVLIYSLGFYGLKRVNDSDGKYLVAAVVALALLFTGFTGFLWYRSEHVLAVQSSEMKADRNYRVSEVDPWDAVRNYLGRWQYFRATGQPEAALAALKKASDVWFSDSRQIIGDTHTAIPKLTNSTVLDFGSEVRFVGYMGRFNAPNNLNLTLFWQKLSSARNSAFAPRLQVLEKTGKIVGEASPPDPLPAEFIPTGYYFSDDVNIKLDDVSKVSPLWLTLSFPIEQLGPATPAGHPHSGAVVLATAPPVEPVKMQQSLNLSLANFYADEPTVSPGEQIALQVVWNGNQYVKPYHIAEVQLMDDGGQIVLTDAIEIFSNGAGQIPEHSDNWFLYDTLCVDTPPSLPNGVYRLNMTVFGANGNDELYSGVVAAINVGPAKKQESQPSICSKLNLGKSNRQYQSSSPTNGLADFGEFVRLERYSKNVRIEGSKIVVHLDFVWQSLKNNPPNMRPHIKLVNSDDEVVFDFFWAPSVESHRVKYWFANELINDSIEFVLPKLASGSYDLALEWQFVEDLSSVPVSDGQNFVIIDEFDKP